MCDTGYTVRDLAADLRDLRSRALDEPAMLREASELVKRLVLMKHNWLRSYMTTPPAQASGPMSRHVLHEEPDHSLALFVVTSRAGQGSAPHDHGTWAVISGLEGWETHCTWEQAGAHEVVARDAGQRIDAGSIVAVPTGTIHSLHNDSDAAAVTLQLYGMNIDFTEHRTYTPRRPS